MKRGRLQSKDWTACACTDEQIGEAVLACPRCSEPECFATCSGFEEVAVADEAEAVPA